MFSVPSLYFLCALCGCIFVACGRKGPPLPPLVHVPGPIADLTARRFGDDVVLQFTIPSINTDGSRPADLDRVEVYAHTGPLPAPPDFLKYGTLVANIAVKPPGIVGASQVPGLEEGARASATEKIAQTQTEIGKMPPVRRVGGRATVPAGEPIYETPETINASLPVVRYYVAVGVSRRNRRGAFAAPLAVPLLSPLRAPGELDVQYTQDELSLAWAPLPRDDDIFVPAALYNVYKSVDTVAPGVAGSPDPAGLGSPPDGQRQASAGQAPLVRPALNPVPLGVPVFKEPQVEFGARRCYVVRAVRTAGLVSIESEASPPACLTPVDTFPPADPRQLAAVAGDNAVSLIWEPNTDKDLAGYLVLRGEAPADKLTPVTPMPIPDTTYRDTGVTSGVSYDYVVVAVDNAPAPNTSKYSDRVTAVVP